MAFLLEQTRLRKARFNAAKKCRFNPSRTGRLRHTRLFRLRPRCTCAKNDFFSTRIRIVGSFVSECKQIQNYE